MTGRDTSAFWEGEPALSKNHLAQLRTRKIAPAAIDEFAAELQALKSFWAVEPISRRDAVAEMREVEKTLAGAVAVVERLDTLTLSRIEVAAYGSRPHKVSAAGVRYFTKLLGSDLLHALRAYQRGAGEAAAALELQGPARGPDPERLDAIVGAAGTILRRHRHVVDDAVKGAFATTVIIGATALERELGGKLPADPRNAIRKWLQAHPDG